MRTFIALVPSQASVAQLIALQNKIAYKAQDKKTPAEKFHLTVFFCGEIDSMHVERLGHFLSATTPMSKFLLTPQHLAFFGNERPKRLVLVLKKNPLIDALYMTTAQAMSKADIRLDSSRTFTPHITLGKIKSGMVIPAKLSLPEIEFSELVVFKSTLTHSGSVFTPVVSATLQ